MHGAKGAGSWQREGTSKMLPDLLRSRTSRPEPRQPRTDACAADSFVAAVCEPLAALAKAGLFEVDPALLDSFCDLRTVENLVLFGVVVDPAGQIINLPEDHAAIWAQLQPKLAALKRYLADLPGYRRGAVAAPHWLSNMHDDEGFDRVLERVRATPECWNRTLMLRCHEAVSSLAGTRPAL